MAPVSTSSTNPEVFSSCSVPAVLYALEPDFFVQIRTLLKLRGVLQQQLVQAIRQGGSTERVGLLSKDISSVNHVPSLCCL